MECGECTMCCELLEIKWLNKPINTICRHCELNKGCKIHNDIDDECKNFKCLYYQMEKVNINLRPDKCKVIFEKISDKLIFGTQHPGFEVTEITKNQVKYFMKEGFSVVIKNTKYKDAAIFLVEGHTHEMINLEIENYLKLRK